MDAIRAVHQCLFCPQTFGSASEKDDHILQHFAHETCIECDQNLIRIGSDLYTRHNAVTCIKANFAKSEEPSEKEYQHANSPTSQEICNDGDFIGQAQALNPIFIEEMELKPDDLNEQLMLRDNCDSEHEPHENHIEPTPNLDQFSDSMGVSESTSNQSSETDDRTKCNICNKILSTTNALKTHKLITHSAPGHFPCQLCNMILTRKDSLRKHMQMKHDPNCVKFKCVYCYAVFLKKSSLENHHPKCKKRAEKLRNEDCSTTVEAVNTIHIKEEQIDDDYENTVCTEIVEMGPAQQNRIFHHQ
ncbi:PR domain zinc finger protein 5-like [Contarinia nasturtii]|uniref:PR domain zinc finger protein 5-like n=1 Tax=Contarinia nasturtii TaxID=265458 RepID=UPI0012D3ED3E|nr:PR domain zinc finger protein 5-like [Contarinia nasturtii]